jgi:hypothetical protein
VWGGGEGERGGREEEEEEEEEVYHVLVCVHSHTSGKYVIFYSSGK